MATVHQLKVTIMGIKPPVWRRVVVPSRSTLAELHDVVQAAFGWWDYHLHEFDIGGVRYGTDDGEDWDPNDAVHVSDGAAGEGGVVQLPDGFAGCVGVVDRVAHVRWPGPSWCVRSLDLRLQADPEVVVDAPVSCWLGWVEPALEGFGDDALKVNVVVDGGLFDGSGVLPGGVVLIEAGGAV